MRRWNRAFAIAAGCLALRAETPARPAAPSYSVSSVVNSVSFAPASFAPYTPATIFGTDLSFSTAQAGGGSGYTFELAGVTVLLAGQAVPLFYVSDRQINFLVPAYVSAGDAPLRVMRSGVGGPEVMLAVGAVAPTLFRTGSDTAIATHANGSLITPESAARPGEIVVLYATGLGPVEAEPSNLTLPAAPSRILRLTDFRVTLNGVPLDASRIQYVGLTPRSAGLYQVNLLLPEDAGPDPEIQVAIGSQSSAAGMKLPVR